MVARDMLIALGRPPVPILKSAGGAPQWPTGIVGSIAHDDEIAVAAIAEQSQYPSVGIDIEHPLPLPPKVLRLVTTPSERERYAADPIAGRLLFAAKEAVYKASFSTDNVFLDYDDITIYLESSRAFIKGGATFPISFLKFPHILVVAYRALSEQIDDPATGFDRLTGP